MTVGDLIGRLLWIDYRLPVVVRAVPDVGLPVEAVAVEHRLTYLPADALVARGPAVVIHAEAGQ